MPLLKPTIEIKNTTLKITINQGIISKIESYCKWSEIEKVDQFFEQAAELVFSKDSDWKKFETEQK